MPCLRRRGPSAAGRSRRGRRGSRRRARCRRWRALARRELDAARTPRGRGPASPAYARVGIVASACTRFTCSSVTRPSGAASESLRRCAPRRRGRGRSGGSSRRGRRATEEAPGRVLALVDRRAERVELVQASPLLVRQRGGARARSARRSARRSGHAARRAPPRSVRRSAARRGSGSRGVAGRARRPRRSC